MRKAAFQIGFNLLVIFAAEFAVREVFRAVTRRAR